MCLARLWKPSHKGVDICCIPKLQVTMADVFFLFLQMKTLEIFPYFLGGGGMGKGQSAIKSPLTSKLITSIQSSFTLLVQWLYLCVNTKNEIQEMQKRISFSDGFPYSSQEEFGFPDSCTWAA